MGPDVTIERMTEWQAQTVASIFFYVYRHYLWRVFLQTLDDYPLRDHPELAELPGFGELAPKRSVLIYLRKARCGTLGASGACRPRY